MICCTTLFFLDKGKVRFSDLFEEEASVKKLQLKMQIGKCSTLLTNMKTKRLSMGAVQLLTTMWHITCDIQII